MSKRLLTVAAGDARSLAEFLTARLALDRQSSQALIACGAVWRSGRRAAPVQTQPLLPGERITVYLDALGKRPPAAAISVVYSDDQLLVVDKPAGLDSQPSRRGGPSLLSLLPGPLHLVHRLDAEASGLMVLARDPKTAASLQAALERGAVTREYLAVVTGTLETPAGQREGRIALRIGRAHEKGGSPQSPRQRTFPPDSPHGQPAGTRFCRLPVPGLAPDLSLLWLRLESGRTHQIRVHLQSLGHPIVGDRLYGGRPGERLLLHAARLCLPLPQPLGSSFTSLPSGFGLPEGYTPALPATDGPSL